MNTIVDVYVTNCTQIKRCKEIEKHNILRESKRKNKKNKKKTNKPQQQQLLSVERNLCFMIFVRARLNNNKMRV